MVHTNENLIHFQNHCRAHRVEVGRPILLGG